MAVNFAAIGRDSNIANTEASAALTDFNTFQAGKVLQGKVTLSASQKQALRDSFRASVEAYVAAGQRILNELAAP